VTPENSLLFYELLYQPDHLAGFGVTPGLELGINQSVVDTDFVPASIGGDESHALDFRFEVFEQIACQAHGPVGVMSDRAVDDLDFHHGDISSSKNSE
jgi:hypothetical protein